MENSWNSTGYSSREGGGTRFFIDYWGKLFPGLQKRVWAGHRFEMCIVQCEMCLFSLRQISRSLTWWGFLIFLGEKKFLAPTHAILPDRRRDLLTAAHGDFLSTHERKSYLEAIVKSIVQNHIFTKTVDT